VGSADCVVAIRMRYPALPATALHVKAGGSETAMAPFTGAVSAGAGKVVPAVKLKMFDHAAIPVLDVGSMDCTSQK